MAGRTASGFAGVGETVMRRLGGYAVILAVLVIFPALSVTASADEVVATLAFGSDDLTFEQHEGYDLVSLEGADHLTVPAEPMLPALSIQLLLPPGSTAADLTVVESGTVYLSGRYTVLPAPWPATFSSRGAAEVPQPNVSTYNSVLPYPSEVARLAGVGSFGGHRLAEVTVTPLQFVPATGELLLHTRIDIVLETEPASATSEVDLATAGRRSGQAARMIERSARNARAMLAYDTELPGSLAKARNGFDYLILCPDAFVDEFQVLADWKSRKGVRTEIVTIEAIASNPLFAGADSAEEIRNCIKHYYVEDGITWVLLGGDTAIVPARNVYDFFYGQGIPCDLYYADLDGSWDVDGDGRWGEHDEDAVDMYSDVFVGRAPVESAGEAATFVAKVLSYEGAASQFLDDYQLRMLFLAEILWDSPSPYTDGGVALDIIGDTFVPDRFEPIVKLYERDGTLDLANAIAALEEGAGIVMHEGHAYIDFESLGPDDITIEDLDALANAGRGGLWSPAGEWPSSATRGTAGDSPATPASASPTSSARSSLSRSSRRT